jgi:hypothetical protein
MAGDRCDLAWLAAPAENLVGHAHPATIEATA